MDVLSRGELRAFYQGLRDRATLDLGNGDDRNCAPHAAMLT
jgi:hypothetical protein